MHRQSAWAAQWQSETAAILSGLEDWRAQHPTATLREIELALDDRLTRLRAQMLERMALTAAAATFSSQPAMAWPQCPQCDTRLEPRGQHGRDLLTHGARELHLEREYGVCPRCGEGLFPPR